MKILKKLLIIEDDLTIAQVEKDYLEVNNFAVDIEEDGKEGLTRALNNDYDLIVLDLMLPNMDGFKICEKIREQKNIPIIIVSARDDEIDKIKGLGLGSDDYITKPFSPNELVARVKANINRYEALVNKTKTNKIEFNGILINKDSREVFVDEQPITLTAKEYELLLLLVENPNIVFSKEKIFSEIWGFDTQKDEPTITVHIRRLREKIEKDPSNPEHIKTIWGVGYKFVK